MGRKKTTRSYTGTARNRGQLPLIYLGPADGASWNTLHEQSFALLSPAEKQAISWQMVVDYWKMMGRDEGELRLDRTTAVLKKI